MYVLFKCVVLKAFLQQTFNEATVWFILLFQLKVILKVFLIKLEKLNVVKEANLNDVI